MPRPLARIALLAALVPATLAAQPAPPATPPARAAAKPAVQPAPRTPVQSAPLVKPRPGAAHTRPTPRPPGRPAAPPVATAVPPPAATPEPEKPAEPSKGSATGAPLPRFAALRSDEVNFRVGPGTKYPIEWLYKRRDLPVRIEREYEAWRLIRDHEGQQGWVNQAVLVPRRTAVVIDGEHVLRSGPKEDADPVARLKPGVILRLRSCEAGADWCQASVQDYRGWIRRSEIWGTLPGEAIQ